MSATHEQGDETQIAAADGGAVPSMQVPAAGTPLSEIPSWMLRSLNYPQRKPRGAFGSSITVSLRDPLFEGKEGGPSDGGDQSDPDVPAAVPGGAPPESGNPTYQEPSGIPNPTS